MKKALIVDDDRDLRELMKTVLSTAFEVKEAGSKKEALSIIKRFMPDLILLDVMMESDSAGFELAREIKNDKGTCHIKILMITSIDSAAKIDFKSEAGDPSWLPVDDYINKPILANDLLARARALVEKK